MIALYRRSIMQASAVTEVRRASYLLAIIQAASENEVMINVGGGVAILTLLGWVYDVVLRRKVGWSWVFYRGCIYSPDMESDWDNSVRNALIKSDGGMLSVTPKGVMVLNLWLDEKRLSDVRRCVGYVAPFLKSWSGGEILLGLSLATKFWYCKKMKYAVAWYLRDFNGIEEDVLRSGLRCGRELLEIIRSKLLRRVEE